MILTKLGHHHAEDDIAGTGIKRFFTLRLRVHVRTNMGNLVSHNYQGTRTASASILREQLSGTKSEGRSQLREMSAALQLICYLLSEDQTKTTENHPHLIPSEGTRYCILGFGADKARFSVVALEKVKLSADSL